MALVFPQEDNEVLKAFQKLWDCSYVTYGVKFCTIDAKRHGGDHMLDFVEMDVKAVLL